MIYVQLIGLGCHNEIILVEVLYGMRPPDHFHCPPLGLQPGMMIFNLCQLTHLVRKRQGLGKILEPEGAFQRRDTIKFHDILEGNLQQESPPLVFRYSR